VFRWIKRILGSSEPTPAAPASGEASCEPWNNRYQLAADTLDLLRELREGPLDEDRVVRHFIAGHDVEGLMESGEYQDAEDETFADLRDFVASSGTATTFGAAIEEWEARLAEFRSSVRWQNLPDRLHELCRRRAEYVVAHACERGWAEREGQGPACRITEQGRRALQQETSQG
jgi:hypothetical protein